MKPRVELWLTESTIKSQPSDFINENGGRKMVMRVDGN